MSSTKNIYAVLVAIEDYPDPRLKLQGCVNDLFAFEHFLHRSFDRRLNLKKLTDADASRPNIIQSFQHFRTAEDDDICIFFFAGHGSQNEAPPAFRHLETDRQLESIVAFDSRLPGGRDVLDKELSYLIWESTRRADVHFVVIMDCCHAGTNTRLEGSRIRAAEPVKIPIDTEKFFGFEHYKDLGGGLYSPPRGRYLQLSAARADQTAKEIYIDGKTRGAFSYALVDCLRRYGPQLSYQHLLHRMNLRVRNLVRNQHPQLESIVSADRQLPFLNNLDQSMAAHPLVSYDLEEGWLLDKGAWEGVTQESEVRLLPSGKNVRILEVAPNQSKIGGMEASDPDEVYAASIEKLSIPSLFAFVEDPTAGDLLHRAKEQLRNDLVTLVDDASRAHYWIHADPRRGFWATYPNDARPVFKIVEGYDKSAVLNFLSHMNIVAKWKALEQMGNPRSSLAEGSVRIDLYRVAEAGNYEDRAKAAWLDWQRQADLFYQLKDGNWHYPAFRLKITNQSKENLWVSALYLSDDFSIDNSLLPKAELKPGHDAWMTDLFAGHSYRTIGTAVDDFYPRNGITHITEMIKIFVATEEIDTNHFVQEGLPYDDSVLDPKRKIVTRRFLSAADWRTYEVPINVFRPQPFQYFDSANPFRKFGIALEAPSSFQGRLKLASLTEVGLASGRPLNLRLPGQKSYFTPFEFTPGYNYAPGLSVLEFERPANHLLLSEPITMTLSKSRGIELIPLGYSTQHREFFHLEHSRENDKILLHELPPATAAFPTGWSSKLFFHLPGAVTY